MSTSTNHRFAPFTHRYYDWTIGEILKTVVCTFTLLPLRLFVMLLTLIGGWLVAILTYSNGNQQVGGWRRAVRLSACTFLGRVLCLSFGFHRIAVTGAVPSGDNGITLICNHSSIVDILLLLHLLAPAFVAKAAVRNVPIVGTIAAAFGGIFVARKPDANAVNESSTAAKRSQTATEMIIERQKKYKYPCVGAAPLVVFPEGTTTNGEYILPFRTGAFCAGVTVQPVIIKYPANHFHPTFESIPASVLLFRMLTQVYNSAHVHFLPPITPNAAERADPKLFAQNVQMLMARNSSLPLSRSTFADKMEFHRLCKRGDMSWKTAWKTIEKNDRKEK